MMDHEMSDQMTLSPAFREQMKVFLADVKRIIKQRENAIDSAVNVHS